MRVAMEAIRTVIFTCAFALAGAFAAPPARAEFLQRSDTRALARDAAVARFAILDLLDFRAKASREIRALIEYRRTHDAYRGDQLEDIHRNVVARAKIKDELLAQIAPHLKLVNRPRTVDTPEELFHYLMSLAVGYTLIDNFQEFGRQVLEDDVLRRIANEENLGFGKPKNALRDAVRELYSAKFHRPTVRGARRFEELNVDLDQSLLDDPDLRFFWAVIEASGTFKFLRAQGPAERVAYDVSAFFRGIFGGKVFEDAAYYSLKDTIDAVSKTFGNTAGAFQSRNGVLYANGLIAAELRAELRPGDILLEKTPFRLTDKFIPGYWGHNAIWLGTEGELVALGLWEAPEIVPLRERIRRGQSVLEALRPGVTTNDVAHFLDVDSYAVMRRRLQTEDELRDVILRAARQYGKEYDFGFDVETQDKLVCSELMYMAYVDVPWRLERQLGRMTINPDAIAERSLEGGEFALVRLILAGEWIDPRANVAAMRAALDGSFVGSGRGPSVNSGIADARL